MGRSRGGQRFGGPGCGARMRFKVPPYARLVARDIAGHDVEFTFFSALRMEDAIVRLKALGCEILTINGELPYDPDDLAVALGILGDNGCRTERLGYPFIDVALAGERWGISATIKGILADPMGIVNRLRAEKRQKESDSAKETSPRLRLPRATEDETSDNLEDEHGK